MTRVPEDAARASEACRDQRGPHADAQIVTTYMDEVQIKAMLDIELIRQFCARQEVDLVLSGSIEPATIVLTAEFDCYGNYFSLVAQHVEYVELAYSVTVGDLTVINQNETETSISPRHQRLLSRYAGSAMV